MPPKISLTSAATGKRVRVAAFRPGDALVPVPQPQPILGYWHLALLIVLLWYPIQLAFDWYFPDAAPLTATQLHKVVLTALVFVFGHGFLWLGLRFNLPIVPRWLRNSFSTTFLALTEWQKIQFFAFLWSAYLLCWAIIWLGASQAA